MIRRCAGALALCAALMLVPAAAQAATGDITEFTIPTANSGANSAAFGPDGNFWFAEFSASKIGRVSTDGTIREFPLPAGRGPSEMTPGPDGNIWFTEFRGNRIGRMSPQGRLLDEFPIPTPNSGAEGIAVGPDGNVWFTENRANKIGRITPSGTITEFPVPTPNSNPNGIVAGADGNMWVALAGSNRIGRITMSGRITSFPVPTPASQPGITAVGPDGNVWFAEYSGNRIGRITPSGAITEFVLPNPNSAPHELVTGPDGAIWFTEFGGNRIGRITTAGAITEFAVPTANSRPEGIRVGSDQNIWFTEFGGNKIGRLVVEPEPVPPPVFAQAIDIAPVGGVVTVQVAGTAKPVPLTAPDQLQVGSTIDTRAGRVRITIADANGRLWSATFYEGVFKITQLAADGGVAQLSLAGGSFKRCGRAARSGAETSAKKKSSKSVRHLWASGDGPFRTKGRFASATIRGTTWNTDDRCDGTLVKVTVGAVTVRDLVRKKSLVVRARRQYLAKAR